VGVDEGLKEIEKALRAVDVREKLLVDSLILAHEESLFAVQEHFKKLRTAIRKVKRKVSQ